MIIKEREEMQGIGRGHDEAKALGCIAKIGHSSVR